MHHRIGRTLIIAGVGVWVLFAAVWAAGAHPDAGRFLPFHLAGVIPGALISRWDWLRSRLRSR